MARKNWTIHVEASRSLWNGSSKTLCGLTITKVEVSGGPLTLKVTCPRCAELRRTGRRGR